MRLSPGLFKTARALGAFVALWLSAGSAWAGGGGADAGSLQSFLTDTLCPFLNMTNCPNLFPNVTELVLETAGLENAPPEMVRAMNAISPTVAVTVGNPPAGSPFSLSNVVPLAFVSPISSKGTLAVVQPGDDAANSFFYAATNGISPTQPPDTLFLTFDYPPLTNPTPAIAQGTDLADITIPLTRLNGDGTESAVPTLLKIRGGGCMTCYTVTATGNFTGSGPQTVNANSLGLIVSLAFHSSPNAAAAHSVITVQVPLLVTAATDPAYFYNPISAVLQAILVVDELGFTPTLSGGLPIGMAPVASQFTARIANITGASVPAVDAYLAIATDGETLVSAPLP